MNNHHSVWSDCFAQAQALLPQLINWRRQLHRHAEGGYALSQTLSLIRAVLNEHGVAFYEPCDATIVAEIGDGPAGMILRADTDALPMQETSGLDFASVTDWAHNCGHDLHTAMLLGAACLLKRHESALHCRTRLLFQPDEEGATGALHVIQGGAISADYRGAFALHVSPVMESGALFYENGPLYASANEFITTVQGISSHGAAPHAGHDPIFCAVQIYNALQGLISRETSAFETAVLSVCAITAGSTYNVVPETAQLRGTLRTYNDTLRDTLKDRIIEVSQGLAPVLRCSAETRFVTGVPSVINDSALNHDILTTLSTLAPAIITRTHDAPFSWSEDFGYFKDILPITMMTLGAQIPGCTANIHNSNVRFDEAAMPAGVCAHLCAALSVI